ncbi:hypothetical protein CARUB_v10018233mg [Capsella rubella]|uniref:Uncharacterized protein n=1 Tax=Capsella rubella TaxID=81985 RepID=R0FRU5_9BRAS|nr:hypothetical protein CARUB_v10018233mg [Capsella rubella]
MSNGLNFPPSLYLFVTRTKEVITYFVSSFVIFLLYIQVSDNLTTSNDKPEMDKRRWNTRKTTSYVSCSEEVTSIEWKAVTMSEEEEDLILRMYKLVGDRWSLIAGRIPGRTPEVIERYWLMKHGCFFTKY